MSRSFDGWRAAGLLMHPTSLPSPYGLGDLGPEAHAMVEFIKKAGFHYWQMLPLTPTSPGFGNSPYSSFSVFAGNPLLISPDLMARDGWLTRTEAQAARTVPVGGVSFDRAIRTKSALLDLAFEKIENRLLDNQAFSEFIWKNGTWLNDYALYTAAKNLFAGASWLKWPEPLKRRDESALQQYGTELARPILKEKFAQFLFFHQLSELKARLNAEGLGLIGDAAFYVNLDSSDVWSQPCLFQLESDGQPALLAGVPPDYFSAAGQLWGNPVYHWTRHREDGYNWWKNLIWRYLSLYDWVRLDHFRAFAAYWAVPADRTLTDDGRFTSAFGHWRPGPGAELFEAAGRPGNIIAEDLGVITSDVTELRQRFGFPGMRVLQFAFGPDLSFSNHAPFRVEPDNVVYSGTHDNNTVRGWFRQEASALQKKQINELSGAEISEARAAWALIRLAWLSAGVLAVTTLQDLLNLDEKARMNIPGAAQGNWEWRLTSFRCLTDQLAEKMAELSALAGRDNLSHPNLQKYDS